MNKKNLFSITAIFLMILLFAGCPDTLGPFDPMVIDQIKDKDAPVVYILSPENNDAYSQTMTVTGEVTDNGTELPVMFYTVSDESGLSKKEGDIAVTAAEADVGVEGTFSFSFTTSEYSTDIILSITATDWNGNAGEPVTLRLVYPGSTLSSFSLTPGNKQVSLSWETVPAAAEYTVFYNRNGTAFTEGSAESFVIAAEDFDESTPVVLTEGEHGISNSIMCRAKVKAFSAGGDEWSSGVLETLPLSPYSLLPKAECFEDRIVLDWRPATGGATYQVWRSENGEDGNY